MKHPYLISKLYGAASKVTNFGEINSQQDRYVFVIPEVGNVRDLCYRNFWSCQNVREGIRQGFQPLTYRPREVQLRRARSMTSTIKYTTLYLYKYRPV